MEISGHGRARDLASLLLGVQDADRGVGKKPAEAGAPQDQIEISEHAKEIQRIKALVGEPDAARLQRVEQLRDAVEAGTYNVDGRQVADALLRHVLTDSVL
jgi:negative regulator of flagellin synthesis FlgM